MKSYLLVNPYIEGSLDKVFSANNSLEAADKAYTAISKYFSNSIPNFKFTLIRIKDSHVQSGGDYSNLDFTTKNNKHLLHFKVKESKVSNSDRVDFSIVPFNGKLVLINQFKSSLQSHLNRHKKNNKNEKEGGKKSKFKNHDDDSSSDSSELYETRVKKNYIIDPITYWWYNPFIYYTDQIYIPSFVYPLNFPYVIDLSTVKPLISSSSNDVLTHVMK
jgi:hypothetical protein